MTFKRIRPILVALLLAFAFAAQAQPVTRVLVLPFDTASADDSYTLGLAAGLQRTLNSVPGVYVPPAGDGALYVGRAFDLGLDLVTEVLSVFDAEAIVSGALSADGATLEVQLSLSGPQFPPGHVVSLSVPNVPSSVVRNVTESVLQELGITLDATVRARVDRIAGQAPSVNSLGVVGSSMARLGGTVSELQSAVESDAGSGWVQSEYGRALMMAGQQEAARQAVARAVELNDGDAESLVNQGIVLSASGLTDEAAAAYQAALALNPVHATALAGLAIITPDPALARQRLEAAVDSYPRLTDAWLDLAALETSDARALQVLRQAAGSLPESIAIHGAFVVRALTLGDAAGALQYLRTTAQNNRAQSPALYSLASYLPASHAEEAIAFAREGSAVFPQSTLPGLAEAFLLRRAQRASEAETLLRGLHAAHPDDVEVTNQLAITLAQVGRLNEARTLFESVSGASPVVTLNLAELLLQDGQASAALQILEPLAAQPAADADTVTLYGQALARTGNLEAAETAFRHALGLNPEWGPAQAGLAQLNEQTRVTGGLAVSLSGAAAGSFQRGLDAISSGNTDTAIIEFTQAAEASGEPLVHFYLGYALQLAGRVREAIPEYEAARAGFPNSDIILNNLGYAQLLLGRFDLAMPLLQSALDLNPQNARAHMNLGLGHYSMQRYGSALTAWEQAVALDPALSGPLDSLLQDVRNRLGQ